MSTPSQGDDPNRGSDLPEPQRLAEDMHRAQRQTIVDGDVEAARSLARRAAEQGIDLEACIEHGYSAGLREVGRLWSDGEFFLPELVQGAEAMKAAMAELTPLMSRPADAHPGGSGQRSATVVLGTVAGDIHDIGKNLVGTLLQANGFRVVDLGMDVGAEAFVDAVLAQQAELLGMSSLLTTTMPGHAQVIDLLRQRGARDRVRVLVGGAPVTADHAHEIGADGYAPNAMAAVVIARQLLGEAPRP